MVICDHYKKIFLFGCARGHVVALIIAANAFPAVAATAWGWAQGRGQVFLPCILQKSPLRVSFLLSPISICHFQKTVPIKTIHFKNVPTNGIKCKSSSQQNTHCKIFDKLSNCNLDPQ